MSEQPEFDEHMADAAYERSREIAWEHEGSDGFDLDDEYVEEP